MSEKHTTKKEQDKFSDSLIFEGMTSISSVLNSPDSNDRQILKVVYDVSKERSKAKELGYLRYKANELKFPIEAVDSKTIDSMTIGNSHGGIIAICSNRTILSLDQAYNELKSDGFYVMIEGVEDPYNFGYALRSLYAAGVDGVILSERNWMGAAGIVARSSAGASEMLPVFVDNNASCVEIFRSKGYKIVCAGIRNSVSIYDADMKKPIF